jgi:hypothetical protein
MFLVKNPTYVLVLPFIETCDKYTALSRFTLLVGGFCTMPAYTPRIRMFLEESIETQINKLRFFIKMTEQKS